jgi:hypothetical protein
MAGSTSAAVIHYGAVPPVRNPNLSRVELAELAELADLARATVPRRGPSAGA